MASAKQQAMDAATDQQVKDGQPQNGKRTAAEAAQQHDQLAAMMTAAERFDYLKAEQKRINDEIKQARAALPHPTKLDKALARQQDTTKGTTKWAVELIAKYAGERMQAGQPPAAALDSVVEFLRQ